MENCFSPKPDGITDLIKSLFSNGLSDTQPTVTTLDGKIRITDKQTLAFARMLLDRVEDDLNNVPPSPIEEGNGQKALLNKEGKPYQRGPYKYKKKPGKQKMVQRAEDMINNS